eukprot:jgi/Chlat1/8879/Chrsp92S08231
MHQRAYQLGAILGSSALVVSIAASVANRFSHKTEKPVYLEMAVTFVFAASVMMGMEYFARYAHKFVYHTGHHFPRGGPFQSGDWLAVINAVPAMALTAFGVYKSGLLGSICFGSGLGITAYGMSYVFIHDGLVHRRFPVGRSLSSWPYLQRVAAAHQMHHADKYDGHPWGLFLGPQEIEAVGAKAELDAMVAAMQRQRS